MAVVIPINDSEEFFRVMDGVPFIELAIVNNDGYAERGSELLLTNDEARMIGEALIKVADVREMYNG